MLRVADIGFPLHQQLYPDCDFNGPVGNLAVQTGTPAMQITNRAILEDGRVYEFSNIVAIDYAVTYIRPFDREIHRSRID